MIAVCVAVVATMASWAPRWYRLQWLYVELCRDVGGGSVGMCSSRIMMYRGLTSISVGFFQGGNSADRTLVRNCGTHAPRCGIVCP